MYESIYLRDKFVATKPGEPFRLFPLGQVIKDGKAHDITAELIRLFTLPHFKPAIKLGSHDDVTPAGGHIIGLEARDDGLYAIPEYNDNGLQALERGAYRYQSPEVIWADGWMEDPQTGDRINGPLIVGTALLHMPHLGEAAALYKVEVHEGDQMSENTVAVPMPLWDKFLAWFNRNADPAPEPAPANPDPAPEPDAFKALRGERDNLAAKIASMEAAKEQQIKLDKFAAQLRGTGLADKEGKVADGAPGMLAGMSDDQAAWAMQTITALSERIDKSALFAEVGQPGGQQVAGDPVSLFKAALEDYMKANPSKTYAEAMLKVGDDEPDLWKAYIKRGA